MQPSAVGRFRGADPEGVGAVIDSYVAKGAKKIELTTNFRGTPGSTSCPTLF